MHKSATKCNETVGKWCKNKHGASKIIDTLETYQSTFGFLQCKRIKRIKEKHAREKARNKKMSVKKTQVYLIFDSGACVTKRKETHARVKGVDKIM
jgi:hypothetical protein